MKKVELVEETEEQKADLRIETEILYGMNLNEQIEVFDKGAIAWTITRVPSGWIYSYIRLDSNQMTSTFVPFDNKFQTH